LRYEIMDTNGRQLRRDSLIGGLFNFD